MYGNGKARTLIQAREATPGQVVFTLKQTSPDVDTSLALGRAVLDWTKDNPDAEVINTLPIVSGGNTVAIHLWYYKE